MSRAITRSAAAGLTALVLAVTAGCGNRVPHDEIVSVGNGSNPVVPRDGAVGQQPAARSGSQGAAQPGPGAAPSRPGPAPSGGPRIAGAPAVAGSGVAPGASGGPNQGAPGSTTRCEKSLSPIVLGQTLATSGLVGASIGGLRPGLAVWAKDINARGGVQCHPVQLIQLDDGSDPARVAANWNTLVHDRGAVAMVGAGVSIAIAALRSAAERDRVPVVGGDVTAEDWVQSPYLFPTGGTPLAAYDGAVADATRAVTDGPAKAGIFYCVEASICSGIKNNFPNSAKRAGAQVGPVQAVSLTQPDFTSECQTMKAAGVNVLFFAVDGSASIRAVRSCASLNYFPIIATGAIAISAAAAADQGLRRNGTYLGAGIVPYTTDDTPGVQSFRDAMNRFAPGTPLDQLTLLGWAAGKLFEAALAKVATEARAGDVTTEMILEGLWQLKKERLDGLSPGVTFTEGKPATAPSCYYGLRLGPEGFAAVRGSKVVCFEGGAQSSVVPAATGGRWRLIYKASPTDRHCCSARNSPQA